MRMTKMSKHSTVASKFFERIQVSIEWKVSKEKDSILTLYHSVIRITSKIINSHSTLGCFKKATLNKPLHNSGLIRELVFWG